MIEGEQICPVAPLGFGEGVNSPAVELFVERARAVAPDFVMNGHSDNVSEICRRLDGIPLAIELAAARDPRDEPGANSRASGRSVSPADRGTSPWTGATSDAAPRSAMVLRSADVSGARRAVAQCGIRGRVFPRSRRACLAQAVRLPTPTSSICWTGWCGNPWWRSIVPPTVVRYSLLETMRQFGENQLAAVCESEVARNRHAQYFAEDARANFELWRSPRQIEAYRWLDREIGNLRAAFRWSVDRGDIETAGNIAANLGDMGLFQLRDEVKLWAAEIVDAARSIRHRRLPMILTWVASAEWYNELRFDTAMRYAEEALDLSEHPDFDSFIWAHADQAFIAALQGNFDLSVERAHAGAAHPVDRQDRLCTALRGYFLSMAGRHDVAMRMVGADVAAAEATGVPFSMAIAYYSKGRAFANADPPAAIAAYERAIAIAHESGNLWWEQLVVADMAELQARTGSPAAALGMFRHMLDLWQGFARRNGGIPRHRRPHHPIRTARSGGTSGDAACRADALFAVAANAGGAARLQSNVQGPLWVMLHLTRQCSAAPLWNLPI